MDQVNWDQEWSAAIIKVAHLIERIFNCNVKFLSTSAFLATARSQALFHEQDLSFFESNHMGVSDLIRGIQPGTVALPLRNKKSDKNEILGVALLTGLAATDDLRLQEISEFLQLAVEARIDAFLRLLKINTPSPTPTSTSERDFLETGDDRVIRFDFQSNKRSPLQRSPLEPTANALAEVISFEDLRNQNYSHQFSKLLNSQNQDYVDLSQVVEPLWLEEPVLLELTTTAGYRSQSIDPAKVSIDLFHRSQLWFYVRLEDLSPEVFSSNQSVRDLGRICIFIEDLAAVRLEQQIRLAEVFANPGRSGADSPRLIAATRVALADLVRDGRITEHFADLFIRFQPGADLRNEKVVVEFLEQFLRGGLDHSGYITPAKLSATLATPKRTTPRQNSDEPPTFH